MFQLLWGNIIEIISPIHIHLDHTEVSMNERMQNATTGWHNSSDHVKNMLHVIITKNMEINELMKSVMNVIYQINSQTDIFNNESQIANNDEETVQIEEATNNMNHPFFDQSVEISKITEKDTSKIMFTDGNYQNGLVKTSEDTNRQINDNMPTADIMEHDFPHNNESMEEFGNTSIIDSKPFQCRDNLAKDVQSH